MYASTKLERHFTNNYVHWPQVIARHTPTIKGWYDRVTFSTVACTVLKCIGMFLAVPQCFHEEFHRVDKKEEFRTVCLRSFSATSYPRLHPLCCQPYVSFETFSHFPIPKSYFKVDVGIGSCNVQLPIWLCTIYTSIFSSHSIPGYPPVVHYDDHPENRYAL